MSPKISKTVEEFEIEATLQATNNREPPRPDASVAEQLTTSTIHLSDGSSLDITALINASLESFLAKKGASTQMEGVVDNNKPGTSGIKRIADPDIEHVAKRHRPSESEESDDEETDCYDSDEDESETLAHVFGDRVNPVEAAKFQALQNSRFGRVDERSYEGSSTSPSRPAVSNILPQDNASSRGLDERSFERQIAPPSQVSSLHTNDSSESRR